MAYDLYPAVDENYDFPPEVRQALAESMELRNTVVPMTTTMRNNLMPIELWDGRLIANTTTDYLEKYDATGLIWNPIANLTDLTAKVDRAGGTMTADPVVDLGVVTKQYLERNNPTNRTLLKDAIWWVDAAASGGRLKDLSGAGRDAVFGAGAAAPLALQHTGEDYIYFPVTVGTTNIGPLSIAMPLNSTITVDATFPTGVGDFYPYYAGDTAYGPYIGVSLNGTAYAGVTGVGTQQVWPAAFATDIRHKFVFTFTATTINLNVDGVDKGTKSIGGTRPAPTSIPTFMPIHMPSATKGIVLYRVDLNGTHILNPSKHHSNYTKIANTGTAGGDWTINRVATGYKTAVVDRPLLLFGGAQTARSAMHGIGPTESTILFAARSFGPAPQHENWLGIGTPSTMANGILWQKGATGNVITQVVYGGATSDRVDSIAVSGRQIVLGQRIASAEVASYVDGVKGEVDTVIARPSMAPLWMSGQTLDVSGYEGSSTTAHIEFLSAAIWDRALTDAEVAQASQELLVPYPVTTAERDTGWRDISSLLINGWIAVAGGSYGLKVRRVGNRVDIHGSITTPATPNQTAIDIPPKGFAVSSGVHTFAISLYNGTSYQPSLMESWQSSLWLYMTNLPPASQTVRLDVSYITNDPWPIVLPGTPT
jgi:hypothetical protein